MLGLLGRLLGCRTGCVAHRLVSVGVCISFIYFISFVVLLVFRGGGSYRIWGDALFGGEGGAHCWGVVEGGRCGHGILLWVELGWVGLQLTLMRDLSCFCNDK